MLPIAYSETKEGDVFKGTSVPNVTEWRVSTGDTPTRGLLGEQLAFRTSEKEHASRHAWNFVYFKIGVSQKITCEKRVQEKSYENLLYQTRPLGH